MSLSTLSLDFTTLRSAYANAALDPVALVDEVYRRIASDSDPYVWINLVPQAQAIEQARALSEARERGAVLPLFGLPYGLKDNIDVAQIPTTASCAAFAYTPSESATVARQLDAAGAIFIGKQNLDQFATGLVGTRSVSGHCRNAFSPEHVPGGSSSGSAVAVAKGHVAFSIGSDTGGSGRVPAACNNIVGLKPTPGLIDTTGFVYCNRSFDVAPVFALTVDDAYEVFDVLAGQSSGQSGDIPEPRPARFDFGIVRQDQLEFFGDTLARDRYERAIDNLVALGGEAQEIDFSVFLAAGNLVFNSALLVERAITYGETARRHPESLHPAVLATLRSADAYHAADVFDALYRLDAYRAQTARVLDSLYVLALPTCPTLPTCEAIAADPLRGNARMGRYTYFANPLRLPVISVPAGLREDGLPFGLSLVAPQNADGRLYALARELHARTSTRLGATKHSLPAFAPHDARNATPA